MVVGRKVVDDGTLDRGDWGSNEASCTCHCGKVG